jgi:hypothetical protein
MGAATGFNTKLKNLRRDGRNCLTASASQGGSPGLHD